MWCSPPSLTLPTIKLLNMSFPIQQYERRCCNWNTMIKVEVKFGGQAFLFAPVTAGNPKHREYDRSANDLIRIVHEFIERIKQEAPPTLRNHAIFEMLHARPIRTLKESRSFCRNVSRHQPIIPYRHLLNYMWSFAFYIFGWNLEFIPILLLLLFYRHISIEV